MKPAPGWRSTQISNFRRASHSLTLGQPRCGSAGKHRSDFRLAARANPRFPSAAPPREAKSLSRKNVSHPLAAMANPVPSSVV